LHDEVATSARRFQKAGVNALGLFLHQVQHSLDHPYGRKHLAVVGDTLLRFDETHGHASTMLSIFFKVFANMLLTYL
jgi:hypothetical protein